jgi:hypothetical protein
MVIRGKNEITLRHVVIGDVWGTSDRYNMEWTLDKTKEGAEAIAACANLLVREFLVERNSSLEPVAEGNGRWRVSSPETSGRLRIRPAVSQTAPRPKRMESERRGNEGGTISVGMD